MNMIVKVINMLDSTLYFVCIDATSCIIDVYIGSTPRNTGSLILVFEYATDIELPIEKCNAQDLTLNPFIFSSKSHFFRFVFDA